MLTVEATTSYLLLCAMLVAIGFGMSFTMPAMTTAVIESVLRARSGITAAVLNASRQVGGVLGVALLGSLVSKRSSFVPGMHVALAIAGGSFLTGCVLSFLFVQLRTPPANDAAASTAAKSGKLKECAPLLGKRRHIFCRREKITV